MKKYLLLGLLLLIGSNLVALAGVAYNRLNEITAAVTLTERELQLPYNSSAQQENSGLSLQMVWRSPSADDEAYQPYNVKESRLSKEQVLALGFELPDERYYGAQSQPLYWALEFDGELHDAEVVKAELRYQKALGSYNAQPNEDNTRLKNDAFDFLEKEKLTNSRLFFVKAAADYQSLATEFAGKDNMIFVKGLAKAYYHQNSDSYGLSLNQLLVNRIMVPLADTEPLKGLSRLGYRDITAPRYSVEVNWGSRLEPWIVAVTES